MRPDETHAPLPEAREHAVVARDGWVLRIRDYDPGGAKAVVVAGHAMMVDSRTLARPDRPCVVGTLVDAGYRVLVPDLRGHGDSGPRAEEGGAWDYDDLVEDVGEYVSLASDLAPTKPIVLVGHSLFGHVSLAWLGHNHEASVDAVVTLAANVWCRQHEPRRWRWLRKRLVYFVTSLIVQLVGRFPTRSLRAGTNDESRAYWLQFRDWMRADRWVAHRDEHNYLEGLAWVRPPVLSVVSEGDRLYAPPEAALEFSDAVPRREVLVLGRDGGPAPGHMALVTDPASAPAWHAVCGWISRQLDVNR